jgi:hypothetical protein
VLRVLQELKRSQLELAKAVDTRALLENSLERYEEIVQSMAASPLLLAAQRRSTVAFVPYDNVSGLRAGTPLYGCAAGLVWCRRVGEVVGVLAGEVTFKHPTQNTMLRGQSVQVKLADARAAEHKVLFAGGRPLLF